MNTLSTNKLPKSKNKAGQSNADAVKRTLEKLSAFPEFTIGNVLYLRISYLYENKALKSAYEAAVIVNSFYKQILDVPVTSYTYETARYIVFENAPKNAVTTLISKFALLNKGFKDYIPVKYHTCTLIKESDIKKILNEIHGKKNEQEYEQLPLEPSVEVVTTDSDVKKQAIKALRTVLVSTESPTYNIDKTTLLIAVGLFFGLTTTESALLIKHLESKSKVKGLKVSTMEGNVIYYHRNDVAVILSAIHPCAGYDLLSKVVVL